MHSTDFTFKYTFQEHGQPDYSLKYSNSPGTHSSNREREHSDVHVSSSRSQSKDSMRYVW